MLSHHTLFPVVQLWACFLITLSQHTFFPFVQLWACFLFNGYCLCLLLPQSEALDLLERLGLLYEADKEKELKEAAVYLPDEAQGLGWQDEGAAAFFYQAVSQRQGEGRDDVGRTTPCKAQGRTGGCCPGGAG